jgi:hypothetical protein
MACVDLSEAAIAPAEAAVMDPGAPYDAQRGIRVLELYQFHPARARADVIFAVLCRALQALPSSDFTVCLALLPEKTVSTHTS